MAIEAQLKKPFKEQLAFFRGKLNIPTERWDALWREQHARGFMIAGAMKAELLADFRAAVERAIKDGIPLREFRKDFDTIVKKHGWSYKGGRNWRSEVIYTTNVRQSYNAGRWKQLTDPDLLKIYPYLEYRHGDSLRPRPHHLAWHGTVLPADDPWWQTHYPQNGWGCRCKVFSAGPRDLKRMGKSGPDTAPPSPIDPRTGAPVGIDKGFDYNVGEAAGRSFRVLADKFETLPHDIARKWMDEYLQGPAFEAFIAGELPGDFPVAVLSPEERAALGTRSQTVWFSAKSLKDHLEKHQDIGLDDYRKIQRVLSEGEVYRQGDTRLIYLMLDGKLYRAAVKTTGGRDENFLLTLFGTSDEKAAREVRARYERIR